MIKVGMIIVLCVVVFSGNACAGEMVAQTSTGNLVKDNQSLKLIPCSEIERIAREDCTLNALNLLIKERSLSEMDNQILKIGSCEQAALYIGRLCKQKNFKNIYKHFALPGMKVIGD